MYGGVRSIGSELPTADDTTKLNLYGVCVVETLPENATKLPRVASELRASDSPAYIVSLLRSAEKTPVESTVKAKTDATTPNAIRIMAVSSPVIPFCRSDRRIGPTVIYIPALNIASDWSCQLDTRMNPHSDLPVDPSTLVGHRLNEDRGDTQSSDG